MRRPLGLAAGVLLAIAGCGAAAAPATTPPVVWERVDPDPGSERGPTALVDRDGLLVGVGERMAWVSPDARTWTGVELPGLSSNATASDVAVTRESFVAVPNDLAHAVGVRSPSAGLTGIVSRAGRSAITGMDGRSGRAIWIAAP